jgi:hypothetical protein
VFWVHHFLAAQHRERYLTELMDLPEPVLHSYRQHFRRIRGTVGPTLHAVLRDREAMDDDLWHLLNRIVDWRVRYGEPLLEPDRFIAAFWGVRCDAQNGGFHQYFSNSAGDLWPDLLRLLVLGGEKHGESHFRRALSMFPDSTPSIVRDQRETQLAAIDGSLTGDFVSPFAELDSEYYSTCFYPHDDTLFRALRSLDDVDFVPDPDVG